MVLGQNDGAPFDYFSEKRNAQDRLLANVLKKKSLAKSEALIGVDDGAPRWFHRNSETSG